MLSSIVSRLRRFKPVDDLITRMDPYKSAYDWISAGFSLLTSIGVFSWISSHWHYIAEQGWAVVVLFSIACSLVVGTVISLAVTAIAVVRISKRQPVTLPPVLPGKKALESEPSSLPASVQAALALGPDLYVLKGDFENQSSILANHHDRIMELATKIGTAIGTAQDFKESYSQNIAELKDDVRSVRLRLDAQMSHMANVLRARQNSNLIDISLKNADELQTALNIEKGDEAINWPTWRYNFSQWKGIVRYVKNTGSIYYSNNDDILSVTVDELNASQWDRDFSQFGGEKNVLEWK